MLRFTCCFLYAMEFLLVLRKGGGDVAITSLFYCRAAPVVMISACRSSRPLLEPIASGHRRRFHVCWSVEGAFVSDVGFLE
jgi:hypothetical protein